MSYLEIQELCILMDFVDDFLRYEVWSDGTTKYKCIWFASNDRAMPSTIEVIK